MAMFITPKQRQLTVLLNQHPFSFFSRFSYTKYFTPPKAYTKLRSSKIGSLFLSESSNEIFTSLILSDSVGISIASAIKAGGTQSNNFSEIEQRCFYIQASNFDQVLPLYPQTLERYEKIVAETQKMSSSDKESFRKELALEEPLPPHPLFHLSPDPADSLLRATSEDLKRLREFYDDLVANDMSTKWKDLVSFIHELNSDKDAFLKQPPPQQISKE
eukprot:TRINITY_DN2109_c0_g1_i1.p1 TRINITY_DN2109_c0_g1~~TRINITY_DN2109_c0_g1_i1.p1  ORF type:complete len:217 (-),score=40.48 TRINITY_DN2109_c0_g1_i1:49-699(-)